MAQMIHFDRMEAQYDLYDSIPAVLNIDIKFIHLNVLLYLQFLKTSAPLIVFCNITGFFYGISIMYKRSDPAFHASICLSGFLFLLLCH